MEKTLSLDTKRLVVTALMIAMGTVISFICSLIPFLNFPFGGGFTVASMLPLVVVSYMYGVKWGLLSSFTYSVLQMILGAQTVMAFFMPSSDDYMGISGALSICFIDYILAYTVIGLGGIFRKKMSKAKALALGSIVALSLRYAAHTLSGYIFFGAYAEWFFGEAVNGSWFLETFSGELLSIIYSVVYNGCYMIPEIIITAVAAVVIARLKQVKKA